MDGFSAQHSTAVIPDVTWSPSPSPVLTAPLGLPTCPIYAPRSGGRGPALSALSALQWPLVCPASMPVHHCIPSPRLSTAGALSETDLRTHCR